jgi:hypothetical protein
MIEKVYLPRINGQFSNVRLLIFHFQKVSVHQSKNETTG